MVDHPVELGQQGAQPDRPRRHLQAEHPLDREHDAELAAERRQPVVPVGQHGDLPVVADLEQLLGAAVQEADPRLGRTTVSPSTVSRTCSTPCADGCCGPSGSTTSAPSWSAPAPVPTVSSRHRAARAHPENGQDSAAGCWRCCAIAERYIRSAAIRTARSVSTPVWSASVTMREREVAEQHLPVPGRPERPPPVLGRPDHLVGQRADPGLQVEQQGRRRRVQPEPVSGLRHVLLQLTHGRRN